MTVTEVCVYWATTIAAARDHRKRHADGGPGVKEAWLDDYRTEVHFACSIITSATRQPPIGAKAKDQ